MTFQVNGNSGKYDKSIQDSSIRYGRNAVENHLKHMEAPLVNDNHATPPIFDFSPNTQAGEKNMAELEKFINKNDEYLNSLPPLEYEYRYMPNVGVGKVDNNAVLAAAFEEMGGVKEIELKEFENKYLIDGSMTAEPLDINKDGKIDISEYATNIIATDLLSKNTTDVSKVDGTINTKGMNAIVEYTKKSNAAAATKLYTNIYNSFGLKNTLNDF